jgi:hypothetical protein
MANIQTQQNHGRASFKRAIGYFAVVVYFGIGVIQLLAIVRGISLVLSLPDILGGFLAFILAWIPLVGSAAGTMGAIKGWKWQLGSSLMLFGGPYIIYFFAIAYGGLVDLWVKEKKRFINRNN